MLLDNHNLKGQNTFGIDVIARYFSMPRSVMEAKEVVVDGQRLQAPIFILGGGSNVLFTKDFDGLIIKPAFGDIEVIGHSGEEVFVAAGAGVIWDDLVAWCVRRNWGGLENLSHIPGTVGAAPVQNIGAYGTEVRNAIINVEGFYIDTLKSFSLAAAECAFGYRTSIFKQDLKGRVFITRVLFSLSTTPQPCTDYGRIEQELQQQPDRSIHSVRQAIIAIRSQKLPDPQKIGNAGSFFKNPMVEVSLAHRIVEEFPNMPLYSADTPAYCKVPAAFLIEKCGWKGIRNGSVGVHYDQPLVLIAFEGATGKEVLHLSEEIQNSVREKFGIFLETEVNIL